jgi:hypothetical protein
MGHFCLARDKHIRVEIRNLKHTRQQHICKRRPAGLGWPVGLRVGARSVLCQYSGRGWGRWGEAKRAKVEVWNGLPSHIPNECHYVDSRRPRLVFTSSSLKEDRCFQYNWPAGVEQPKSTRVNKGSDRACASHRSISYKFLYSLDQIQRRWQSFSSSISSTHRFVEQPRRCI